MIIDMRTKAAGPDGILLPGHRYTVTDQMGQPLVDGGYATLFEATAVADVDPDDATESNVDGTVSADTITATVDLQEGDVSPEVIASVDGALIPAGPSDDGGETPVEEPITADPPAGEDPPVEEPITADPPSTEPLTTEQVANVTLPRGRRKS